ncbi:hypothetical protein [Litorivivens sp.]|uniref:hypothetical protein n=1 Tax=Litorivivens sp. TaxID=2020868 RepID=UPI0035641382
MRLLLIVSLVLMTACSGGIYRQSSVLSFDCSLLVGRWVGYSESQKWNHETTYVEEYLPMGIFKARYQIRSENGEVSTQEETRSWFCDGTTFGTFLISTSNGVSPEDAIASHKVYEIIELSESSIKYRTVIGNEVGKEYHDRKIP